MPGLGVDRPVLMVRAATLSYYHYDGSGSVIAMTDVFGVVVEAYAFGPFGESADEKVEILQEAGVTVAPNPSELGATVAKVFSEAS